MYCIKRMPLKYNEYQHSLQKNRVRKRRSTEFLKSQQNIGLNIKCLHVFCVPKSSQNHKYIN